MGNVNTLQNKMDQLSALKNQQIYQEGSMYLFTESLLTHLIPDANVHLPGFTTVRADRDAKVCEKGRGGGLMMYINRRWCNPSHASAKVIL